MFSEDEIKREVEKHLNDAVTIPNGKKGTLFAHIDTDGNLIFGTAVNVGNGWQVQALMEKHKDTGLDEGIQVLKSW